MLFPLLLDAGGSPWGIGSPLSPPVLIMGQRKEGRTLITHLKKSLDFMLFSYFSPGFLLIQRRHKEPGILDTREAFFNIHM